MANFELDYNDTNTSFSSSYDDNGEGFSWPELVENFLQFLRGCGYPIHASDFIEYVHSRLEDLDEAEEIKCEICGGPLDD